MRATRLLIKDFQGIRALETELGTFTLFSGGNGQGKTSVFDAIKSLAKSGKEPESINKDAEEALIQFELKVDETDKIGQEPGEYRIERKIRKDGYSNSVKLLGGKKPRAITSPGEFVSHVFPDRVYDPAGFARAEPKAAADLMRSLLLVKVTDKQLRDAAGLYSLNALEKEYADGISETKKIELAIREERTKVNGAVDALDGNIQAFGSTLDLSTPEDVSAKLKAARTTVADLDKVLTDTIALLDKAKETSFQEATEIMKEADEEAQTWYMGELEKLNKLRDEKRAAIFQVESDAKAEASRLRDKAVADLDPKRDELAAAKQSVTALEEKDRKAAEMAGQRKQLEAWEKDLKEKRRESERMTMAIEGLAVLQRKLMESCSIEGFSIDDGELYYDGVKWNKVNLAMRTMQAVNIGTMFQVNGEPIILDCYEALDPDSKAQLEEAIFASGIQVMAFERTTGPLTVETFDKPREITTP